MRQHHALPIGLSLWATTLTACLPGGPPGTATTAGQSVTVAFAAMVGDEPFACSRTDAAGSRQPRTYSGIGTSGTTLTPTDCRFYVHDVHLLDAAGKATPVTLEQDGKWQVQNVALLDFEDKTGLAVNGTTDTNAVLRGRVPAGVYTGIRFTLGVPQALNHADATKAPSPLNLTGLFWSWQGGYKHARLDFVSTGQPNGFFVHLGSAGCTTGMTTKQHGAMMPVDPASVTCSAPNRPTITLTGFVPGRDTVVADLKALLQETNLDANQGSAGCMSEPGDPDCAGIMAGFGLPSGTVEAPAQRFFRVQAGR